ncbi:ABC transporter ATP-binding protein [Streptomyces tuirus]|uniref:ABC transporter ATP-binding protein n=1 Tax=Streptomyces tuirus TaxID=68278 RepID=A0A941FD00_9ACTN|nr:ABC transporter ATP-binding protein [Streptomyces tuirus]
MTRTFRRKGRNVQALAPVSLSIPSGQFLTIVGPSGCGKSTLLQIMGGFDTPSTGTVTTPAGPVTGPSRDIGMVFQRATLFPWWTVEKNVAWALRCGGTGRREALQRSRELLDLVGLGGFETAYPNELSGGMQQRAALARTLSLEPSVLLMDEPFGALDAQTRELMQEELIRIRQAAGTTIVFVTHDIREAVFLGDRIVALSGSPGSIALDLAPDLPRPHTHEVMRTQEFLDAYETVWACIRDQASAREPGRSERAAEQDDQGESA